MRIRGAGRRATWPERSWEQLRELAAFRGTTLQEADAGLDLAVHQTLTHGGKVEVIGEEHRDLEPVGGVAALLRF